MLRSGGLPSNPSTSFSGYSNIASMRLRLAPAAEDDNVRRLISSFRQCGVAWYTSSQARESKSLSCLGEASGTSAPRQNHMQAGLAVEKTQSRWVRRFCSAMASLALNSRRAVRSDSSSGVWSATHRRQTNS